MIACAAAFIETGSWFVCCRLTANPGFFYVSVKPAEPYDRYLKNRDPLLGWPWKSDGPEIRDRSGSLIIPAYHDPDRFRSCVSLYGDSFVASTNVEPERAWANLLARLLRCRTANYGVDGYGTDQAFLRYQRNTNDRSSIVVLGHLSRDILRNVNRFRNIISPGSHYGLKPRFILRNGELELTPVPNLTEEQYQRLLENPNEIADHEYFALDGPSGYTKLRFPYSLALFKSLEHFGFPLAVRGVPRHMPFYRPDHPSNALRITEEIIAAFTQLAHERGQQPIVLIFAGKSDLLHYERTGNWIYQSLLDRLTARGVDAVNMGQLIVRSAGGISAADLFDETAHFNEFGNYLIAHIAQRIIQGDEPSEPLLLVSGSRSVRRP